MLRPGLWPRISPWQPYDLKHSLLHFAIIMNIWDLAKNKLQENRERAAKLEDALEENVDSK